MKYGGSRSYYRSPSCLLRKELMSIAGKILADSLGIARTCGPGTALNWLSCISRSARECARVRNLQPADRLMGRGPFTVKRGGVRARLTGEQVFSGIREIWVRDVYLKSDFLRIEPGSWVVDLGA